MKEALGRSPEWTAVDNKTIRASKRQGDTGGLISREDYFDTELEKFSRFYRNWYKNNPQPTNRNNSVY